MTRSEYLRMVGKRGPKKPHDGSQVVHGGARATERQMSYLGSLARRAGYRHASQAIKDCIGKNPVNGLSRDRASHVIEWLRERV